MRLPVTPAQMLSKLPQRQGLLDRLGRRWRGAELTIASPQGAGAIRAGLLLPHLASMAEPMDSTDDPQAPLSPVRHSIDALSVLARSARGLPELQRIDHLLTYGIFDSLCNRGVPLSLVSDLVWPAVAALTQQAETLDIVWKPTLSLHD